MSDLAELKKLATLMYEEIGVRLQDPALKKVVGCRNITALYGPPMVRPDVALVSFQGGGGDRSPLRLEWPDRLLYLDDEFKFGRELRRAFKEAGLYDTLEHRTVAMAACFPEAPTSEAGKWSAKGGPRADWREFSSCWVRRMLRAMQPCAVLVFGGRANEALGLADRWRDAEHRHTDEHLVYERTEIEDIPAVYCRHLSQGAARGEVQRCLLEIKRLVEVGGKNIPA